MHIWIKVVKLNFVVFILQSKPWSCFYRTEFSCKIRVFGHTFEGNQTCKKIEFILQTDYTAILIRTNHLTLSGRENVKSFYLRSQLSF